MVVKFSDTFLGSSVVQSELEQNGKNLTFLANIFNIFN